MSQGDRGQDCYAREQLGRHEQASEQSVRKRLEVLVTFMAFPAQ